ncbi:MAG: hypothetical protein D6798_11680 [Deltaproteobacteria bacterium]|nr:MAG: hypothetical protein D6798_11680 [Deltaproteobacteria bacterium]
MMPALALLFLAVSTMACRSVDNSRTPPGPQGSDDTGSAQADGGTTTDGGAPGDTGDTGGRRHPPDDDGDGFFAGTQDCDDQDPDINPAQDEVPGNGVDEDCDGSDAGPTRELADAAAVWQGEQYSMLGARIVPGGDVDGDGIDDLLIGAPWELTPGEGADWPGTVYVVPATMPSGPIAGATATVEPEESNSGVGWAIGGGQDWNGDGYDDLVIGMPYSVLPIEVQGGHALVYYGPVAGMLSDADADIIIDGSTYDQHLGFSVGLLPESGTAQPLLAIGSSQPVGGVSVVDLWATPPTSGATEQSATWRISGTDMAGGFGVEFSASEDLSGDGIPDLIVTEPQTSVHARSAGTVYVIPGPIDHDVNVADGATALYGNREQADVGMTAPLVHPDTNGDGYADLVVSGSLDPDAYTRGGKTWLVRGPITDSGVLDDVATAAVLPERGYEWLGRGLASPGDLDGDGLEDLAISAPRDWYYGADLPGKVYLFPSTITGTVSGADASLVLQGEHFGDYAGASLAGGFDANGDGRTDLAVGAARYDYTETDGEYGAGRVYLLTDLAL